MLMPCHRSKNAKKLLPVEKFRRSKEKAKVDATIQRVWQKNGGEKSKMKRQIFLVCLSGNGDEEEDEEEEACGGEVKDLGIKKEMMRLLHCIPSCRPLPNFNQRQAAKSILRLTVWSNLVATTHPPNRLLYQIPMILDLPENPILAVTRLQTLLLLTRKMTAPN